MDGKMPQVLQQQTDQYSATAYASLLKVRVLSRTAGSLVIKNQHATATLKYKILVSNDPQGGANTWAEEKAEATLAGAAIPVRVVLTGPFVWVDVQIASNGAGESPQGSAWFLAVGL